MGSGGARDDVGRDDGVGRPRSLYCYGARPRLCHRWASTMRKLHVLLFSIVGALLMGLLWTIGETGRPDTNAHLCEFARHYFPDISPDCQAADWIVSAAGWLFVIAVLIAVVDLAWIVAAWKGWNRSSEVVLLSGFEDPPVGGLQFITSILDVDYAMVSKRFHARVRMEIRNTTGRLIQYEGSTAGRINGMAFQSERVPIKAFVYPDQVHYIISTRLFDLELLDEQKGKSPIIDAFFEYELVYGFAGSAEKRRKASKGVRVSLWGPLIDKSHGTVEERKIVTEIYEETEL